MEVKGFSVAGCKRGHLHLGVYGDGLIFGANLRWTLTELQLSACCRRSHFRVMTMTCSLNANILILSQQLILIHRAGFLETMNIFGPRLF